jgi:hypothetical protein
LTTRGPIRISPSGYLLEPGDHAQQRRLAAARGSDQHQELTVGDAEVDVIDREVSTAVDLGDLRELDGGHSFTP